MGNHHRQGDPKWLQENAMKLKSQRIQLIKEYQMHLTIYELQVFPHGLDGLRLWQAGIILSRYVILNSNKFKNKDVLELGSGVGISGIVVKKWTQCKSITMSDYNERVIENIKKNSIKNKQENIKIMLFDWKIRQKYNEQFDIIIGSDIVYYGCPVKDLYEVFKKYLKINGQGIIIIPNRQHYADLFIKEIQNDIFQYYHQQLIDSRYKQSVLDNQQQSKKLYPMLINNKFYAYHLVKKKCNQ